MSLDQMPKWMARRTTRRSFLTQAGRLTLAMVGISVVGDHIGRFTPSAEATNHTCNDEVWCGLYGRRCNDSACGGGVSTCPNGYGDGGSWTACCNVAGNGTLIRYIDCCSQDDATQPCGTLCQGPWQPNWCGMIEPGLQLYYRCTKIQTIGTC